MRAIRRKHFDLSTNTAKCLFVWENLGPTHVDRLNACASAGIDVSAIQFAAVSATYSWRAEREMPWPCKTLISDGFVPTGWRLAGALWRAVRQSDAGQVFLCHYSEPAVMIAALLLRLTGRRRVWLMADSKFDDFPRKAAVERIKALILRPYHGAIVASRRSADYFAALGLPRRRIVQGYDTIDIARIRGQGNAHGPPRAFGERDFVVVARLVPKKNIAAAIAALALYRGHGGKRRLSILGDGPLESELRDFAARSGVADAVEFRGFVQTADVSDVLRGALALVLPSVEEQFGFVVIEAMALGIPVICSRNAGAVDLMVDDGENGFVVEPTDVAAIARAMFALDSNELRWRDMAEAAERAAMRGDASHFADGVRRLLNTAD